MSVSVCDSPENSAKAFSKSVCESSSTKAPLIFKLSIAPSLIGSSPEGNNGEIIINDMTKRTMNMTVLFKKMADASKKFPNFENFSFMLIF